MPRLSPAERFQRAYQRRPAPSEWALQRSVCKWCAGVGKGIVRGRFFAVPNGASLTGGAIGWKRLKDAGAQAGVPDLVLFREDGAHLYLELKDGTSGRLTEAQLTWLGKLHENNVDAQVARSLAQAVLAIMEFFTTKP